MTQEIIRNLNYTVSSALITFNSIDFEINTFPDVSCTVHLLWYVQCYFNLWYVLWRNIFLGFMQVVPA